MRVSAPSTASASGIWPGAVTPARSGCASVSMSSASSSGATPRSNVMRSIPTWRTRRSSSENASPACTSGISPTTTSFSMKPTARLASSTSI
jgi:hypothetical protein